MSFTLIKNLMKTENYKSRIEHQTDKTEDFEFEIVVLSVVTNVVLSTKTSKELVFCRICTT